MYSHAIIVSFLIATGLAQDKFFKKYAFTKAMTNCFGDDLYYADLKRLADAEKLCQQQRIFIKGMPHHIDVPIYAHQQPGYYADVGGQTVYVPVQSYSPNFIATGQHDVGGSHRHGRHTQQQHQRHLDRFTLQDSVLKVQAALSNFTCTLRKLKYIDDNLNLRTDTIFNDYYKIPIDNNLRDDLIEGIDYCNQLVSCLPLQKLKSPLPLPLIRLVRFTQCERKTRLGACFKHDLRKNINQFDLSGLQGIGGRSNTVDHLMTILVGAESLDELELY
ncbi:uncharacterized protein LOC135217593 [Macrobrachium nipponense]|uniref:uncharacterized protein LOC135217593 n=1 Tax=Macrobrachium nipponense TaxID=159736 RepID=UPI0030C8D280